MIERDMEAPEPRLKPSLSPVCLAVRGLDSCEKVGLFRESRSDAACLVARFEMAQANHLRRWIAGRRAALELTITESITLKIILEEVSPFGGGVSASAVKPATSDGHSLAAHIKCLSASKKEASPSLQMSAVCRRPSSQSPSLGEQCPPLGR